MDRLPPALAFLITALVPLAAAEAERPNIVFVMADDHANHALSSYGSVINETPHLDRLAAEGMRFTSAFVTNSICAPSRAVILTGKHSHLNGVITNREAFDGSQQHIGPLLQEAGYQTAIIGKWHLKSDPTGFDYWNILPGQGDYYDPDMIEMGERKSHEGYVTDIITDFVLDYLENRRDRQRPFFLMYHHKAPHREWAPGPDHLTLYDDVDIPEPATLFDDWSGRGTAARVQEMTVAHHLTPRDLKEDPPEGLEGDDLVRWKYQRYIKDYLRTIASIDDNMGRLLDYLDASGLAENTVVVYTSDQGFFLGDHGWYDKRFMYEESLRMPLLVRWPGRVDASVVRDEMVLNLDFAQTFLALAGADEPGDMQGRSLLPLLEGETPDDWRQSIYYRYYEYPAVHMVHKHYGVRTDRYKLIHFHELKEWELYDLVEDPDEMQSVYDDPAYAEVRTELEAELARLRDHYRDDDTIVGGIEPPRTPRDPRKVVRELAVRYDFARIEGDRLEDLSGKGHHGIVEGGEVVAGRFGRALELDGRSRIFRRETPESLGPDYRPLVVGAHVRPAAADGVVAAIGGVSHGYSLHLDGGVPRFVINAANVSHEVVAPSPLPLDAWSHLAGAVGPDGRLWLLVDGRVVADAPGAFIRQTPADVFEVGADTGSPVGSYQTPRFFRGLIEDFRLYWGPLDRDTMEAWVGGE